MSSVINTCVIASIAATAALTAKRFIGVDGALCAADALPFGVALYDFDNGETAAGIVCGIAVVEASGAITAGARVKSAADGKAAAAADVTGAVNAAACGVALEAATGAGQFIRIKLCC